jgi:cytochrome c
MRPTLKMFGLGLVTAASSLWLGNVAIAADAENGGNLYTDKMCYTCHGANAKTPLAPGYPKLAGQDEIYLINQIKAIKDKKRTNDLSFTMVTFTTTLTDENIADIAAWIAAQPVTSASK